MVKKISALLLALVLCLSVVVIPASAAVELGDASIAFSLEWDKSAYKAGDIAYLSVYMDAADDVALYTGTLAIGLNSAVFSQDDNSKAVMASNTTELDDNFFGYYKSLVQNQAISWYPSTIATNIGKKNTAEENALYDQYLKITFNKNASGSHPNAANQYDGFYGSEFDPTTPVFVIGLVVKADVADGTAVNAAMTSGSTQVSGCTIFKQYTDIGNTNKNANIAATATSVSQADTTKTTGDVTIGAATIVNPLKGQMRYGKEAGTYDVRALAVITGKDFTTTFGSVDAAKTMITEIGFVFASGSNISAPSMDAVEALVEEGTAITGYKKVPVTQLSTGIESGSYVFSCIVEDIPAAAAQTDKLIAVGYVAWDSNADGVVDSYNYYTEAQTIDFADYYKA